MTRWRAFTVLELLTVITILAILAAILLPSLGAARRSADKARTKAFFAQWGTALEAFRREYGHYPSLDPSGLINGGATSAPSSEHFFHDVLAGRSREGTPLLPASAAARENPRRIAFHVFADSEINDAGLICDATGNPSIAVLVDRNLDGRITIGGPAGDYETLPRVLFPDGSFQAPPHGSSDFAFPSGGLRAGVAFYVAASGGSDGNGMFVVSWK